MDDPPVDVLIIGGGPAGLFSAFYAGLRQLSARIVDSLDKLGGQLTTLYPEKQIYDVAGFPEVRAKELAEALIQQGLQFGASTALGHPVKTLRFHPDSRLFEVRTSGGCHFSRVVLIAAGIGAFTPRRLPLPAARSYEGRGLAYHVRHVAAYRGQRVLIIGGGDSAIEWANALAAVSHSQVLIHRRDAFRAVEASVTRLRQGPTRILTSHELRDIGGIGKVEWVTLWDHTTQTEQRLQVDAVLVNTGFESTLGPIQHWGLALQGSAIAVDSAMRTSQPGVYAVGDIASYPGKLKLIAVGFGEAAIAVNQIATYLNPSAKLFPGHSTDLVPRLARKSSPG